MKYIEPEHEIEVDDKDALIRHASAPKEEYDIHSLEYRDDNLWVYSYLVADYEPMNPLDMTDREMDVYTNDNNRLITDDRNEFNRHQGIIDDEYYYPSFNGELPDDTFPAAPAWDFSGDELQYDRLVETLEQFREYKKAVTTRVEQENDGDNCFPAEWIDYEAEVETFIDELENFLDGREPSPFAHEFMVEGNGSYRTDAIIVPRDSLVKEFIGDAVEGTPEYEERAGRLNDYMEACAREYRAWTEGDVYGIVHVVMVDGYEPTEESCWGFCTSKLARKELESEHKSIVENELKKLGKGTDNANA